MNLSHSADNTPLNFPHNLHGSRKFDRQTWHPRRTRIGRSASAKALAPSTCQINWSKGNKGNDGRAVSCLGHRETVATGCKDFDTWQNPPTPLWRWRRAYWGANSYTKCLITFVNIAVAISALAGEGRGGAKTISHRDLGRVVFARFFDDFWVSELKRPLKRNLGSFWSASGKGKTDRNEKTL